MSNDNDTTTTPDTDAALLAGIALAIEAGTMSVFDPTDAQGFTASTGLAACAHCHGAGTRANTWTGAREECTPCEGTGLCLHGEGTAARLDGDTIASAWECDECGHLTAWDDETYAFCNATPWSPRAPEGTAPLTWTLMSRGARLAAYAPEARA